MKSTLTPYSRGFYEQNLERSRRSAQVVVPMVLSLIQPRSVIDVGCGVGSWLAVFREHGVEGILGVDGSWVKKGQLQIPAERFIAFDLTKRLRLDRQFDLAVSLEVAEHLPADCAETFVDSLVALAPVVLFSAAIPFQGGTHHVNERWPDYWAELFERRGYAPVDCIRPRIWDNRGVEWHYAQNTLLFVRRDRLEATPLLKAEFDKTARSQLALVHPRKYLWLNELHLATRDILSLVPPGSSFILVDQGEFGSDFLPAHRPTPFLERDGQYWGPPPDDETAVAELERLREAGAQFIIFASPALWWLDHYTGLRQHLGARFPCVLENGRTVAFDLRPSGETP